MAGYNNQRKSTLGICTGYMCLTIKKKLQGKPKWKNKTQFEETKQASESDIAEMLVLSDWKFKITD